MSYMNNAAGRRAAKKDARRAKRKARVSDRIKKREGRKAERVARRNKRKGIVPDKPVKKPPFWGLQKPTKPGTTKPTKGLHYNCNGKTSACRSGPDPNK